MTNFHRYLFGTGFAYLVRLVLTLVNFFVDYYVPGSDLQGYTRTPRMDSLLLRLLGPGTNDARHYPLFEVDFNFFYTVFGAAVGGLCLLILYEVKSRRRQDDNGLFSGYHFSKMTPGAYIKAEWRAFRAEIPLAEYAWWWAVRLGLIIATALRIKRGGWDVECLIMTSNCAMTFVIPLMRVLFFAKLYFGKIPYRAQTMINCIVFFGAFLGHAVELPIHEYDKLLHVVSGSFAVLIGHQLILATRRGKSLSAAVKTLASTGFSALVMILWEIFEFLADHYMVDSFNQNQLWNPDSDHFFFQIFGRGAENAGSIAVLDTGIDLLCAVFGCALTAVGLYFFLKHKTKTAAVTQSVSEKERVGA